MLDKFRQQHLVWDFANEQVYEAIISSSGDSNGRTLAVTVYDAGTVSDLTGTELYLAWQRKDADFAGEDQFAAKDITKGEYELTYSAEMISHAGKTLEASFRIKLGENTIIESRPFEIIVMRSVYNEAAEKSGEFSILQAALVRLATIEADEGTRQANEQDRIDLYELVEQKLGDGDFDGADGVGLQYDWSGTQLGIKREDESTYDYTDLEGDKGDTGDTWKPSVSESGYLTWAKDSSGTTPTARDIKGPKGDTGDISNLTSTHIENALGFLPIEYSEGTNVQISEAGKISATDTKTTINGKTGAIAKADIVALGIPGQDTTYTAGTNIEIASGVIKNIVTDQGTDPDWAGVKYKFVMINGELFAEVVAV